MNSWGSIYVESFQMRQLLLSTVQTLVDNTQKDLVCLEIHFVKRLLFFPWIDATHFRRTSFSIFGDT